MEITRGRATANPGKTSSTSANSNPTRERLRGTPFKNAGDLDAARQEIVYETWHEVEKAKARRELMRNNEYRELLEPFLKGLSTGYGEDQADRLASIAAKEDFGVEISINQDLKTSDQNQNLLETILNAMSSSFYSNYLKAIGALPIGDEVSKKEIDNLRGEIKKVLETVKKKPSSKKK